MVKIDVMEINAKERSIVINTIKKIAEDLKNDKCNVHINHILIKDIGDYEVEYEIKHDEEVYTECLGQELYLANLDRFIK